MRGFKCKFYIKRKKHLLLKRKLEINILWAGLHFVQEFYIGLKFILHLLKTANGTGLLQLFPSIKVKLKLGVKI